MKRHYSILLSLTAAIVVIGTILGGCALGDRAYATPSGKITLPASSPAAASDTQLQGIWVSGIGEISVTPDLATLWLGIEAQKPTVKEAQEEATRAMEKVMAALKKSGIAEKDIQTAYFSIYQRTYWDDDKQKEEPVGFQVTNQVIAKIRNIKDIGTIIDSVAAAGGDNTRINNLNFSVEEPARYYDEARAKAMEAARHKAEQLAQLAGVTLGQATYIAESSNPVYPMAYDMVPNVRMSMGGAPEAAVSTSISPGQVDITLTIQMAYTTN